ncbi:MAG: lactate racemase domain-containing protein [Chthoniobacter sp.]|uniref:lactate racemase domain-containing protein n=1 Tax=Chthoniobacter sp. TaxID=2510640 RepID=UPI0032A263D4
MNKKSRRTSSRRTFLANAASSGLLVALGKGTSAFAEAAAPGADKPAAAAGLPANFANPADSPIHALLKDIPLPRMVPIETTFDRPVLVDVGQAFVAKLRGSRVLEGIWPGMSIAVGAGSRGIANLPLVTRLLIEELKKVGAHPFLFPAMGSHGGATPEGQRAVLERMGMSAEKMGAPIQATMEVVQVGSTPDGLPAYVDAIAAAADGIIVVNRIKPHTSFRGKVESGLSKMIVIGVGKQKGAETCHNLGYGRMEQNLVALCRATLASGKILFGVGLVENAYHETSQVEIVPAVEIEAQEPRLLEEARKLMPTVPIQLLDVLLIDEVGKNISGTGFDPNVVGRYPTPDVTLTERDPRITRIAVLNITDVSDGNGTGLGLADFTTERVFRKFNFVETYCNLLTSTTATVGKIPMVMRNDQQAVQAAIKTCLIGDPRKVRLARIKSTLSLDRTLVSENLVEEALRNPRTKVMGPAAEMAFDGEGNLR